MADRRLVSFHGLRTLLGWLAVASSLLILWGCRDDSPKSTGLDSDDSHTATEAHVVVQVHPIERRRVASTITALGQCEAPPDQLALLTPAVEGQVSALLVDQGAQVEAGQPIVQLDDTLARADLAEKQAVRDSLIAARRLLESIPRPEEQEASKLAIEHAAIAVAQTEAVVARLRPLRARTEVSEQQMYDAEQSLEQARIQQRMAQSQFDLLMQPPRDEAIAEAQSKVAVANEAVTAAEARLALFTIRAPIGGILDSLTCRPGQTISIGANIGTIVDSRIALVKAWLPIRNLRQVREGQNARIYFAGPETSALNAEGQTAIFGKVIFIGDVADTQTGNVPTHVTVDNADGRLVIGETVYVEITLEQPEATLAVPIKAVHDEGEGSVITVVREGKAVVLHPQFGSSENGWIVVTDDGLNEGELVIVEGAYNLPDGIAVRTQFANDSKTSSDSS